MWSNNKKTDCIINIMLILFSMNFMHYGHIVLPVICLIIFFENGYSIKINNIKIFLILVLFSISFFIFSYHDGLYSVIAFFLPMAYFIGSNLKEPTEENIKNVIYLLTLGMCIHVALNCFGDFFRLGLEMFKSHSHHDFWTNSSIAATATAVNYTFMIGIMYYLCLYEKNMIIKKTGLCFFVFLSIYNIALGRRTPVIMAFLVFFVSFLIDAFKYKNKQINFKTLRIFAIILAVFICLVFVFVYFDFFGLKDQLMEIRIIDKFLWQGLNPMRIGIFIDAIKLSPYYLWGGKYISGILGIQIHDLWMDTYDYCGIVPFILLVIHTIYFVRIFLTFLRDETNDRKFKILQIGLFFCILMQMLLEPIMTGSSIFLIATILVESCLENYENNKKVNE